MVAQFVTVVAAGPCIADLNGDGRADKEIVVAEGWTPLWHGVELCRELQSQLPGLRCLMLTSFDDHDALMDAIMAGAMDTPIAIEGVSKALGIPKDELRAMRDSFVPLRAKMGTAWDIAHASLFLASDEAQFITGVILPSMVDRAHVSGSTSEAWRNGPSRERPDARPTRTHEERSADEGSPAADRPVGDERVAR